MDDAMSVQCNLEIMTTNYDHILLLKGSFPFLVEVGRFPEESFKLIKNTLKERGCVGQLVVRFEVQMSKLLKGGIKTHLDNFSDEEFTFLREDIEHSIMVVL